MEIEIQLTDTSIGENVPPPPAAGAAGAWLEFRGVVRGNEGGQPISALEYEAYPEMAVREIRRILESLAAKYPCQAAKVIHRVGVIPAGEAAIYVGVASPHRAEAIALLAEFMDRLKQDVPIWKRRGLPAAVENSPKISCVEPLNLGRDALPRVRADQQVGPTGFMGRTARPAARSLDEAVLEIQSRCRPLPAVRAPLADAFGRVLRETVCAPHDLPDCDRSTRDGFAILPDDASEVFQVVDTLHAGDWHPRQLKPGEAVRVATGAALPCEDLRVVMQENVERDGGRIRITKPDRARNVRQRGEEVKAGQPLVPAWARLDAGKLALLASAGCAQPLVSPPLRVVHFTTGDEIVPPDHAPQPGQIRDSNSTLVRGLLRPFPGDLRQAHLPEDFAHAQAEVSNLKFHVDRAAVVLVSGGASVGDKDFTRPLLEWLGFEIVFSQVNVRPGRPLIFGHNGSRVAFGLPGNPLSHFVCFHVFVAAALAGLAGAEPAKFLRARLAEKLDDPPCPRETLWPALWDWAGLHPRAWASSGDPLCLGASNALIRVPANQSPLAAGAEVEFLPAGG